MDKKGKMRLERILGTLMSGVWQRFPEGDGVPPDSRRALEEAFELGGESSLPIFRMLSSSAPPSTLPAWLGEMRRIGFRSDQRIPNFAEGTPNPSVAGILISAYAKGMEYSETAMRWKEVLPDVVRELSMMGSPTFTDGGGLAGMLELSLRHDDVSASNLISVLAGMGGLAGGVGSEKAMDTAIRGLRWRTAHALARAGVRLGGKDMSKEVRALLSSMFSMRPASAGEGEVRGMAACEILEACGISPVRFRTRTGSGLGMMAMESALDMGFGAMVGHIAEAGVGFSDCSQDSLICKLERVPAPWDGRNPEGLRDGLGVLSMIGEAGARLASHEKMVSLAKLVSRRLNKDANGVPVNGWGELDALMGVVMAWTRMVDGGSVERFLSMTKFLSAEPRWLALMEKTDMESMLASRGKRVSRLGKL